MKYNKYFLKCLNFSHKFFFDFEKLLFKEVTYKPNCPVPIIEQSQKLMIAAELARAGKKKNTFNFKFLILLTNN